MISHRRIQQLLYDYLTGEVDPSRVRDIETHLRSCARCAAELNDMREAAGRLRAASSEERPDEFWDALLAKIQERIRIEELHPVRQRFSVSGWIDSLFIVRRPVLAFTLVIVACVVAALAVWVITFPATVPRSDVAREQPAPAEDLHSRTDQYLRRSQTLLVGLANMKASGNEPIDLTAEREASRALIHEARYLKHEELDPVSAQVVYGLEPILVELANSRGDQSRAAVDLLRQGIFQRNLLFKVRMAELMRDSTRFLAASSRF
jgi:Putative zinc-finger